MNSYRESVRINSDSESVSTVSSDDDNDDSFNVVARKKPVQRILSSSDEESLVESSTLNHSEAADVVDEESVVEDSVLNQSEVANVADVRSRDNSRLNQSEVAATMDEESLVESSLLSQSEAAGVSDVKSLPYNSVMNQFDDVDVEDLQSDPSLLAEQAKILKSIQEKSVLAESERLNQSEVAATMDEGSLVESSLLSQSEAAGVLDVKSLPYNSVMNQFDDVDVEDLQSDPSLLVEQAKILKSIQENRVLAESDIHSEIDELIMNSFIEEHIVNERTQSISHSSNQRLKNDKLKEILKDSALFNEKGDHCASQESKISIDHDAGTLKEKSFEDSSFTDEVKFNSTVIQGNGIKMSPIANEDHFPMETSSTDMFGTDGSGPEIIELSDDVISDSENEISSKANATNRRQQTLPEMNSFSNKVSPAKKKISKLEYVRMKEKLVQLNSDRRKLMHAIGTIKLENLPDRGHGLKQKLKEAEAEIKKQENAFMEIEIQDDMPPKLNWRDAATVDVQPRTFGKQALETHNTQKSLTLDRLQNLHSSLKNCPTPETLADDPPGLKLDLMIHQKYGLAWLSWREGQKPPGGILADDMGLGKTLMMLSLILTMKQRREAEDNEEEESDSDSDTENEEKRYKYKGGTLVVCPASVLGQWVNEIRDKFRRNCLTVETYHGPKREPKAKRLKNYDVVVTTYAICQSEGGSETPLYRIKWERIILDEAHAIRNHKSKTAVAIFSLAAKYRWALTGTPVHNKEDDLFALLKFLRCSPFDDLQIFKRWISQKNSGGHQRLHTVLSSLLLRRTKLQLQELEQLTTLPERDWQLIEIEMDEEETRVYQKILLFSRTLFAQFLHQRAEKNADMYNPVHVNLDPSSEYYKMHQKLVRMNRLPDVKQSHILVLLLRLRQICCHPSLIIAMLDSVADLGDDVEDGDADESINLLEQINRLTIDDQDNEPDINGIANDGIGLAEASRNLLNPSNPIFEKERQSSKIREVIKLLEEKIIPTNDKAVIVSQWTSLLHLIVPHLIALNISHCSLDGSIPVKNRGEIINNFNNPASDKRIMLLSLTAGGVGLNLVGANHLVFLDLHWNPQLELQAQDRIYRLGQKKKVYLYQFITTNTIEQRVKGLQDQKKALADAVLTGAKIRSNKLSIDDLKSLFNM